MSSTGDNLCTILIFLALITGVSYGVVCTCQTFLLDDLGTVKPNLAITSKHKLKNYDCDGNPDPVYCAEFCYNKYTGQTRGGRIDITLTDLKGIKKLSSVGNMACSKLKKDVYKGKLELFVQFCQKGRKPLFPTAFRYNQLLCCKNRTFINPLFC